MKYDHLSIVCARCREVLVWGRLTAIPSSIDRPFRALCDDCWEAVATVAGHDLMWGRAGR